MGQQKIARRILMSGMPLVGALTAFAHADVSLSPVALSGTPAPGGGSYVGVFQAAFTNSGQLAFGAVTSTSDPSNPIVFSLFSGPAGGLKLLAQTGQAAPGAGTAFTNFNSLLVNDNGYVSFTADLADGRVAVYGGFSGNLNPVALSSNSSPPPGVPAGANYSEFALPLLSGGNQIAFGALLSGTGVNSTNTSAAWVGGAIPTTLIARAGDTPSQLPGETYYSNFLFFPGSINQSNQIAFSANLLVSGASPPNNTDSAVFTGTPGNLSLALRQGQLVSGTPLPGGFGNADINNAGHIVLVAGENSLAAGSQLAGEEIVTGANANFTVVVGSNSQVPGSSGGVFGTFGTTAIAGDGQIVFSASTMYSSGIYETAKDGSVISIASDKGRVPGLSDGTEFALFNVSGLTINSGGQVAFESTLQGPNVDNANDTAIFATDAQGVLQMLVRDGQMLDVNGQMKQISGLFVVSGGGGQDGLGTSFNDAGQLAFSAKFTDGSSGLFIANLPEPTLISVFAFGGIGLLSRRRCD